MWSIPERENQISAFKYKVMLSSKIIEGISEGYADCINYDTPIIDDCK